VISHALLGKTHPLELLGRKETQWYSTDTRDLLTAPTCSLAPFATAP
jgi:hypothetical protein